MGTSGRGKPTSHHQIEVFRLIASFAQIEVMDEKGENMEVMWIRPANGRPVSEGYQPNYPNGLYKDQPPPKLKIRGDSSYRS
jgi:hypothetical protein